MMCEEKNSSFNINWKKLSADENIFQSSPPPDNKMVAPKERMGNKQVQLYD